jgi:hypothetical protein
VQDSKVLREEEGAALKKWFLSQKRFTSWNAMERALNVTEDYLHHIASGKKRAINPELRAKLRETTSLEIFKPISRSQNLLTKSAAYHVQRRQTSRVSLEKPKDNADERATRVKRMLVALADELEFFKQNPEQTRTTFRRVVPGEDVGYITTLLRAFYDEDQFQRWLLFSDYKLKSKEENKNVPAGKA